MSMEKNILDMVMDGLLRKNHLFFRYGGITGTFAKAYLSKNSIMVYLTHCSGGTHKSRFEDELDRIWFPNVI